jgi:hypothetical protein
VKLITVYFHYATRLFGVMLNQAPGQLHLSDNGHSILEENEEEEEEAEEEEEEE